MTLRSPPRRSSAASDSSHGRPIGTSRSSPPRSRPPALLGGVIEQERIFIGGEPVAPLTLDEEPQLLQRPDQVVRARPH
jgi:hypothetical protein